MRARPSFPSAYLGPASTQTAIAVYNRPRQHNLEYLHIYYFNFSDPTPFLPRSGFYPDGDRSSTAAARFTPSGMMLKVRSTVL